MTHACFRSVVSSFSFSHIHFISSRYKVAITKHKDEEQTSSSLFGQNYMWTPIVDFSKYIEDNEVIDNEVLMDSFVRIFLFSRYVSFVQIMIFIMSS